MFSERTSVGVDVHARSVVGAAIDGATGELLTTRLAPDVDRWPQIASTRRSSTATIVHNLTVVTRNIADLHAYGSGRGQPVAVRGVRWARPPLENRVFSPAPSAIVWIADDGEDDEGCVRSIAMQ